MNDSGSMPLRRQSAPKRSERCQLPVPTAPPPRVSMCSWSSNLATCWFCPAARKGRSSASKASPCWPSSGFSSRRPSASSRISSAIWSQHGSNTAIKSDDTSSLPARKLSSTLSTTWVKRTIWSSPNRPEEPLMVCAARKMALMLSAGSASFSRLNRQSSISSNNSRLSRVKVARASCISLSIFIAVTPRHGPARPDRRSRW